MFAALQRVLSSSRLAAGILAVACLMVLSAAPASADDGNCQACHEVDREAMASTVHGFLDCGDCHGGALVEDHTPETAGVDCATCHDEVATSYAASIHGQARANGSDEAPGCLSCHGTIHVLVPADDPDSPINPANLPGTCGSCHADPEMARKFHISVARPVEAYESSIHARGVSLGEHAASCSDCHGSHDIQPGSDARSHVNHNNVPATCGQCHEEIASAYDASVHGVAAAQGVRESPVCTDCHGEHRILAPSEPGSPVYTTNIPKMTCGRCHGDERINEKFGIPGDRITSFADSYHGLAGRSGALTAANCASCHGVHDILPSTDSRSAVHPDNLPQTCGNCHPGALAREQMGPVHVVATEKRFAAIYYIRLAYLWIIFLTIGGMLLHNGLDLFRKMRNPPPRFAGPAPRHEIRMSAGFRAAHFLMLSSFIVLVYTGFALKFPEAWWARPLLAWEGSLGLRGLLHRVASVVMMGSLVLHALHLILRRKARACIAGMLPTLADVHEVRERLLYFAGRRATPPAAGSLGYPEKLEYLALIWGSLLMAATGFLLWFDNFTLQWLPVWVPDVATIVHLYEAILASLSILVWHFYFVIFDPVVYPMDTAFLTGRSPLARIKEREGYAMPSTGNGKGPQDSDTETAALADQRDSQGAQAP